MHVICKRKTKNMSMLGIMCGPLNNLNVEDDIKVLIAKLVQMELREKTTYLKKIGWVEGEKKINVDQ